MKKKKIILAIILSIFCVILTDGCGGKKKEEENRINLEIYGTEYPENGTWRYSLTSEEEEELAYINVKSELIFNEDEGLAVDEYGNVYMLYYSSNPYQIQIYQVEMPGAVDSTTQFGIDANKDGYGFAEVSIDDELYIIKTSSKKAVKKQFLENINEYPEPLEEEPKYEVIKAERRNFEKYTFGFEVEDEGGFFLSARIEGEDSYEYKRKFRLNEITKHYLGEIITYNDVKKWLSKEYESYQEVETAIQELSDFLDDFERKHREEIGIKFLHSDNLMNTYPEVAKRYSITQNELGEIQVNKLELEKYLDVAEKGTEKYVYSKHQELIEEYPELAAKYGNVFVSYVKINVEEESMKKYLDMLSLEDRKEFFEENFQSILEIYPELAVEYIDDIPDSPQSIPEEQDFKVFLHEIKEKYPEKLKKFLQDKGKWIRSNYSDIL